MRMTQPRAWCLLCFLLVLGAQAAESDELALVMKQLDQVQAALERARVVAVQDGQNGPDDTDALLAMMGFASADAAETGEITPSAELHDPGEAFWQWLVTGCCSGSLISNKPDGGFTWSPVMCFCVRRGFFTSI